MAVVVFLSGVGLIALAGPLYAGCFRSHAARLDAENRAGKTVGAVGSVLLVVGLMLFLVGTL